MAQFDWKQYGKITKVTKTGGFLHKETKVTKAKNSIQVWRLAVERPSFTLLVRVKVSVFVAFAIFPYCELRFWQREELGRVLNEQHLIQAFGFVGQSGYVLGYQRQARPASIRACAARRSKGFASPAL
jgi:hypothetical protein